MGKVTVDLSISLDGFVAGQHSSPERPLGDNGRHLYDWAFGLATWRKLRGFVGGESNLDDQVIVELNETLGAAIMGRRTYDNFSGLWGDIPPFHSPIFVLCHDPRETTHKAGGTTYNFVSNGIESALEQARAAADDKNVVIVGGADISQQYISARLVDEIQVHVVPILFGSGLRLFDNIEDEPVGLERIRVIDSPDVTHLLYRVVR